MPTIIPDPVMKQYFLDKLQEKCAPVRNEIHVSDLVYCLRKAFFRRKRNKPLTMQQLVFYLDGHQRHAGLQGLVSDLNPEQPVEKYGVVGHPDLASAHPIEIKTTRARPNNGSKPEQYLRQCAYYCILTGTTLCNLITQYINDNTITFERVEFTPEELTRYQQEMGLARAQLQAAFLEDDPAMLPDLKNWQCDKCEFAPECDKLERRGN